MPCDGVLDQWKYWLSSAECCFFSCNKRLVCVKVLLLLLLGVLYLQGDMLWLGTYACHGWPHGCMTFELSGQVLQVAAALLLQIKEEEDMLWQAGQRETEEELKRRGVLLMQVGGLQGSC